MKTFIGIAVVVLVLTVVGWITFSSTNESTSINLETEKIQPDTEELLEEGRELVQKATEELDDKPAPPAESELEGPALDTINQPAGNERTR